MAIAFDASSKSHDTTGSVSESSFSWNHVPTGTPKGVLVFVGGGAAGSGFETDIITSVTYGGETMTAVTGGFAQDTGGESGFIKAYFLGASGGVPLGTSEVVVNRTSTAAEIAAICITVTSDGYSDYAGVIIEEENQLITEENVDDGSPGANSLRFCGMYSGSAGIGFPGDVGANSTGLERVDFGARGIYACSESAAGQGSRPVGFINKNDDTAGVYLAVIETAGGSNTVNLSTGTTGTETISPNSIESTVNLSGQLSDIQDNPGSGADSTWLTAPGNNYQTEVRIAFPTPTGPPQVGTGLQEFRYRFRKTNHSVDPLLTVQLWENGVFIANLLVDFTVTTTDFGQARSSTWNATSLNWADGSQVELKLIGTPGTGDPANLASVEFGAMEWTVDYKTTLDLSSTGTIDTVSVTVSAALNLTSSDATSTGAIDTAAATQLQYLTSSDATSTGAIDPAAATHVLNLTSTDATSTGEIDTVLAAKTLTLTSTDADSTGAIDTAAATQLHYLTSSDATSTGAIDTAAATHVLNLASTDADSTGAIDTAAAVQIHDLTAADATSTGAIDTAAATHVLNLTSTDATSTGEIDPAAATHTLNLTSTDADSTGAIDTAAVTQLQYLTSTDADATGAVDSVSITAEGALNLTSSDADATGAIDTAAIVQVHVLAAADATSTGAVDTAAAQQVHALAVDDATSTGELATVIGDQEQFLALENLNSSGEIDTAAATQLHYLTAVDATSTGAVDTAAATQLHDLVSSDADSTGAVDAVTVTTNTLLAVSDADSTGAVDTAAATQLHYLAAADADSTGEIDAVTFVTPGVDLTVADIEGSAEISTVDQRLTALSPLFTPTVDRLFKDSDTGRVTLNPQSASGTPAIDALAVAHVQNMAVQDAEAWPTQDKATAQQVHYLPVNNSTSTGYVENFPVTVDNLTELLTADADSTPSADEPAIALLITLDMVPAVSEGTIDTIAVLQTIVASAQTIEGPTAIDGVQITTTQDVSVDDATASSEIDSVYVSKLMVQTLTGETSIDSVEIFIPYTVGGKQRAAILISV